MQDWEVDSIDVKQMYLNSKLHHDMYLKLPVGTKVPPGKALKLVKGLYGLKPSGCKWNTELDSHLQAIGFYCMPGALCLYSRGTGDQITIITAYVDDMLIVSPSHHEVDHTKREIMDKWGTKDNEEVTEFLGIKITWEQVHRRLSLDLTAYIKAMVSKWLGTVKEKLWIPMQCMMDIAGSDRWNPSWAKQYQELVGQLLWVSNTMQPDISFAVGMLVSEVAHPKPEICSKNTTTTDPIKLYEVAWHNQLTKRYCVMTPRPHWMTAFGSLIERARPHIACDTAPTPGGLFDTAPPPRPSYPFHPSCSTLQQDLSYDQDITDFGGICDMNLNLLIWLVRYGVEWMEIHSTTMTRSNRGIFEPIPVSGLVLTDLDKFCHRAVGPTDLTELCQNLSGVARLKPRSGGSTSTIQVSSSCSATIKLCDSYCLYTDLGVAQHEQYQYEGYEDTKVWFICIASNTAPALSPESTLFVEYCTGGPSSTTPVLLELCVGSFDTAPPPYYPACLALLCLLSCVDFFNTAPPPQDLLAGLLYTAPPPSTGDDRYLGLEIEGPMDPACNTEQYHHIVKNEAPMSTRNDTPVPALNDFNHRLVGHEATPGPTPSLVSFVMSVKAIAHKVAHPHHIEKPLELVLMDVMGPLHGNAKFAYVLIIHNAFSGMIWVCSLASKGGVSQEVTWWLEEVHVATPQQSPHLVPNYSLKEVHVDQGVMGLNAQEAGGSLVHMEGAQSPWRPWTPMDSHAKEDQAHMQGGPGTATKRTKLKEHADGYHSGARETRVKRTITGQRRRSSVEGVDTRS
ncbi:uncharacterized protein UHOR_14187 [Ustilago hordei]|uniref:Reverse transcriptase Ty1/copia-type domain-containing protein n=1 Tax=Ustilago hordei TaxID=120017 RepID=I2FSZ6_USTHO|nr:uncharacterized protein UHOR_14187 [Ustilago hordei]